MKIRYLPPEDRQTLRILRHTTDVDEIASILNDVLHRPFTLQSLWEYHRWFFQLTAAHIERYPILAFGIVNMRVVEGNLEKARKAIDAIPEDNPYKPFCELTLPGLGEEQLKKAIEHIEKKGKPDLELLLTGGRPSVLNGMWDLSALTASLEGDREEILRHISALYGDQAEHIYNVMVAEAMYWRGDYYNALVRVVGAIPFLKERSDLRLLFVALTLEIYVMVIHGQAPAAIPMMDNLRQQMKHVGLEAYMPNLDAMHAWCAMYDGDYAYLANWMREGAPDENGKFCMLDLFRYMVKMRAYIIQSRYLAVTALAMRLLPLLEMGKRHMDLCELHIIWAMSDYAAGRKQEALDHVEKALVFSQRYSYDRIFADEAQRALELLKFYRRERGGTEYLDRLIRLSEATAAIHPRYMKSQLPEKPALTATELRVLRLLADLQTNGQIAEVTGMAEETVKKHCKHIFSKLEVKNRAQAVRRAAELGIIEPPKYPH